MTDKEQGEEPGQDPDGNDQTAKLIWHSGRILLSVALAVLIVWWRVRNGGEISEAIDSGLALFNDVAMTTSLLAVAAIVARTWRGAKPLAVRPKKKKGKKAPATTKQEGK